MIGRSLLSALIATTCVSSCAFLPRTPILPAVDETPPPIDFPRHPTGIDETAAVTYLPIHDGVFQPTLLTPGDPLPTNPVGPVFLNGVPVLDALRLVLGQSGISVSIDNPNTSKGEDTEDPGAAKVTVMNLRAPLAEVVDIVCRSARVYCLYKDKNIHVTNTETFTVPLPPVDVGSKDTTQGATKGSTGQGSAEEYKGIASAMKVLTGHDATIDEDLRTLTYTVSFREKPRVDQYFEHVRKSRSLLIFDTYIWEVTLSDSNRTGIQWNKLKVRFNNRLTSNLTNIAPTTPDTLPLSFSTIFTGNALTLDALVNFLQTQGSLKTVSQPKISIVNGSTGSLTVGGKTAYVKEVGTVALGSTATGTTTQTTVKTDSIDTGLQLQITGDFIDGTIFSSLDITLTDIVQIRTVHTSDTQVELPETTNRQYSALARVRPGDTILLAGLNSQHTERTIAGPPTGTRIIPVPTQDDDVGQHTELVIVMRPRVIAYGPPPVDATNRSETKGPYYATADDNSAVHHRPSLAASVEHAEGAE